MLNQLEARFHRGKLYDLTLRYANPELNAAQTKAKFLNARKALTARYGNFKLNTDSRSTENSYTTSHTSYHIEPVSGLFLMLSYTEVSDNLRQQSKATFSLTYHNDNLFASEDQ